MASNKFVRDIRKIVNIDPSQSTLAGAPPKTSIPGKRGIGLSDGDGATSSSQSGTAGVTRATNIPKSGTVARAVLTSAENPNNNQPGGEVDPNDPLKGVVYNNQGTYNIEDLLDGLDGPTLANQTTEGVGQTPISSGSTLNGLTGLKDLVTDQEFELRIDGLAKPPTGWNSATDPGTALPEYDLWTLGKRWLAPAVNQFFATPREAAVADRNFAGDTLFTVIVASNYIVISDIWQITFENPITFATVTYQANGAACTPTFGSSTCPITSPLKWPTDSKMQLVLTDGVFRAAEQEAIDDYITRFLDGQHSRIDFAFATGREGSLRPAQGGGYLLGETTAGVYSSVVQHFDSKGKLVAYISPDMASNYEIRP